MENIERADGIANLEELNTEQKGSKIDFYFAFCSRWQKEVLQKYSSILCLDSTYNTCYALDDNSRKAYLYTIVVKHDRAGKGVPVAFMLTSSEAQGPLTSWLLWLKHSLPLEKSPIFMIDCSKTEMAAINTVFQNPEIRLCFWHMLRAIRMQASSKIHSCQCEGRKRKQPEEEVEQTSELRKSAVSDMVSLIKTQTAQEFAEEWKHYKLKYEAHQDWIAYLTKQWMDKFETWWHGNRKVSPDSSSRKKLD